MPGLLDIVPVLLGVLVLGHVHVGACRERGAEEGSCSAPSSETVLVTGSNGQVGSWIVRELLEQGHTVHAAVRDVTDPHKVSHLRRLEENEERLKLFSTGDLGRAQGEMVWDEPMEGCDAVIHVSMAMDWNDGLNGMYNPTLEGTRQLLSAIERHAHTVKSLILTSSTAAVATQMEGITDESHWRNAQDDRQNGSWYSATKIAQEQLATHWAHEKRQVGILPSNFRFVAICPTRIMGPPIHTTVPIEGWLNQLRQWLQHPPTEENETIEFVHIQDVARMHLAALENTNASGRYLAVGESWHWNEFLNHLQQLYPGMPPVRPYQRDDKVAPKRYSQERRNSLLVEFRPMAELLQEAVEYHKARGELGSLAIF